MFMLKQVYIQGAETLKPVTPTSGDDNQVF